MLNSLNLMPWWMSILSHKTGKKRILPIYRSPPPPTEINNYIECRGPFLPFRNILCPVWRAHEHLCSVWSEQRCSVGGVERLLLRALGVSPQSHPTAATLAIVSPQYQECFHTFPNVQSRETAHTLPRPHLMMLPMFPLRVQLDMVGEGTSGSYTRLSSGVH